jgi:hypothetical protein
MHYFKTGEVDACNDKIGPKLNIVKHILRSMLPSSGRNLQLIFFAISDDAYLTLV